MGEFEEKLNGILNNPAEMEKILTLARGFMGSGGDLTSTSAGPTGAPTPPTPTTSGADIAGLMGSLDPNMIGKLAKGFSGGVGSAALLQAMTPHLKMERQGQLKRALAIAQMLKAAKAIFD